MVPLSRSWQIMIHGTLVKITARSWQDLDKITMVCHGSYQGYHVKNSIEPFSVIESVPKWKDRNKKTGITSKAASGNNV